MNEIYLAYAMNYLWLRVVSYQLRFSVCMQTADCPACCLSFTQTTDSLAINGQKVHALTRSGSGNSITNAIQYWAQTIPLRVQYVSLAAARMTTIACGGYFVYLHAHRTGIVRKRDTNWMQSTMAMNGEHTQTTDRKRVDCSNKQWHQKHTAQSFRVRRVPKKKKNKEKRNNLNEWIDQNDWAKEVQE